MNASEQTQQPVAPSVAPPPPPQQRARAESLISPELMAAIEETEQRQLIALEIEARTFSQNQRLASAYYESQYFGDVKSMAQAVVKIELGRSWGMSAADAMKHIYFINGRPSVMEEYMAGKMMAAGLTWRPQFIGADPNCKGCRLFLLKDGEPMMEPVLDAEGNPVLDASGEPKTQQVRVEFTEADAKGIKVWEKGSQKPLLEKSGPWSDGWRKNMYYWRTIAQVRRFHMPNVLTGALMPEESRELIPERGLLDDQDMSGVREGTAADQRKVRDETIARLQKEAAERVAADKEKAQRQDPPKASSEPVEGKRTEDAPKPSPLDLLRKEISAWVDTLPNGIEILGGLGYENAEQIPEAKALEILAALKATAPGNAPRSGTSKLKFGGAK